MALPPRHPRDASVIALTLRAGTSAAAVLRMPSQKPFALYAVPSLHQAASGETWAGLDAELARWLRQRTWRRATRTREDSSLDSMAMALRRVRVTLEAMTEMTTSTTGAHDPTLINLVSRAYRWAIRIARELETIERLELDPIKEWERFESFAPFARAFYESALAAPFAAAPETADVARLQTDIGAVMAPIIIAMMSSAWAA